MVIRKILSGAVSAFAVLALTSWASVATAALPEDVAAALSPDKTPAQQAAAVQALAVANAGNQANYTQLVQLVAAGIPQSQAASFTNALGAACGASGNNAQTTQTLVNIMVGAFTEASGAITAQAISAGCSAEVAANTLQQALLSAAGQFLALRQVIPDRNPGAGVNLNQEAFIKSLNTTRLGNRDKFEFPAIQTFEEGAVSPTTLKDEPYTPPEVVTPPPVVVIED
jgi:hypothetical protein